MFQDWASTQKYSVAHNLGTEVDMACIIMFRNTNSIVSESDVTNGHENQTVETTLIRPVNTRWNSYYMMMDVVQNKKSAIRITAQNPELALPPSKQVRY